jgi:hypothetical protein
MNKRKSIILIIFLSIFAILGIAVLCYVFRGVEKSVESKTAQYTVTSDELFAAFEENETTANEKFLGKIIEVTGEVSSIEKTATGQLVIVLSVSSPMGGVRCTFETQQEDILKKVSTGTSHTVKGKCSGLLMEVVLDNCSLKN